MLNIKLDKKRTIALIASSALLFLALFFYFSVDSKYPKVSNSEFIELESELNDAIELSIIDKEASIRRLERLGLLPKLLENRKNYVLGTLYEDLDEKALAFLSYYNIDKKYLTKHSLWKLVQVANKLGFERVVLTNLERLIKYYPKEPKFLYEYAKSFLRQSLFAKAKDSFMQVQKLFYGSDYALGADYYLANLSDDLEEKNSRLINYISNSPDGSFAPLVADQLLNLERDEVTESPKDFSHLHNKMALSYFHAERYKKANELFTKNSEPETSVSYYPWYEHAQTLAKLKRKDSARSLIKKHLVNETNETRAKESLEFLLTLFPKYIDLQDLREILPKMQIIKDKVLWHTAQRTRAKSDYQRVYAGYPDSFYAPESMARAFWKEYKRASYHQALQLYNMHWQRYDHARSHAFVAYWAGKIHLKQGHRELAKATLQALIDAHPRDYYSFRAEALLDDKKNWHKLPPVNEFITFPTWKWPEPYSFDEVKALYGKDVLELMTIHQYDYILSLEEKEVLEFDKDFKIWLYSLAGDNWRAISTAYFSLDKKDAIDYQNIMYQYAYPLLYADLVADEASKRLKVDPLLAHALIKQESRYQPDIVSRAGAIGLMQLMPYTAKAVARDLRKPSPAAKDLMNPEMNIALGVKYMEDVFQSFNNNMIYAIASYNAGPVALRRWVNKAPGKDPDLFIEEIPYEETKGYVKKVLMNYWIYKKLYT